MATRKLPPTNIIVPIEVKSTHNRPKDELKQTCHVYSMSDIGYQVLHTLVCSYCT